MDPETPDYLDLVIEDTDKRYIRGWASVDGKDIQNDRIRPEVMARAFTRFMDVTGGIIMFRHLNRPIGKVLQWAVELHPKAGRYGIRFLGRLYDEYKFHDIIWDAVKRRIIRGFSIGADIPDPKDNTETVNGERDVKVVDMNELSGVIDPAMPFATLDVFATLAKSAEDHSALVGFLDELRAAAIEDMRKDGETMDIQKARKYISDPSQAPQGANVQRGARGGYYYEGTGTGPAQQPEQRPQGHGAPTGLRHQAEMASSLPAAYEGKGYSPFDPRKYLAEEFGDVNEALTHLNDMASRTGQPQARTIDEMVSNIQAGKARGGVFDDLRDEFAQATGTTSPQADIGKRLYASGKFTADDLMAMREEYQRDNPADKIMSDGGEKFYAWVAQKHGGTKAPAQDKGYAKPQDGKVPSGSSEIDSRPFDAATATKVLGADHIKYLDSQPIDVAERAKMGAWDANDSDSRKAYAAYIADRKARDGQSQPAAQAPAKATQQRTPTQPEQSKPEQASAPVQGDGAGNEENISRSLVYQATSLPEFKQQFDTLKQQLTGTDEAADKLTVRGFVNRISNISEYMARQYGTDKNFTIPEGAKVAAAESIYHSLKGGNQPVQKEAPLVFVVRVMDGFQAGDAEGTLAALQDLGGAVTLDDEGAKMLDEIRYHLREGGVQDARGKFDALKAKYLPEYGDKAQGPTPEPMQDLLGLTKEFCAAMKARSKRKPAEELFALTKEFAALAKERAIEPIETEADRRKRRYGELKKELEAFTKALTGR